MDMPVEEEPTYEVDPSFALPDLAGFLPDGGSALARAPVTLAATYYDTADLRWARGGMSLRFRRDAALVEAGATTGQLIPTFVRALGEPATRPAATKRRKVAWLP